MAIRSKQSRMLEDLWEAQVNAAGTTTQIRFHQALAMSRIADSLEGRGGRALKKPIDVVAETMKAVKDRMDADITGIMAAAAPLPKDIDEE